MKKRSLYMLLAIVLLSLTAVVSAQVGRQVTAPATPVVQDQNLKAVIDQRMKTPAYANRAVKPTSICATDGNNWSCTAQGAADLRRSSTVMADGARVDVSGLKLGPMGSDKALCYCERNPDDPNSQWKCTPPGCAFSNVGERTLPDVRSIDRTATPRQIPGNR